MHSRAGRCRDIRWESPLMGWTSSADPVQALKLQFNHVEEAIQFAQRNGLKYRVEEVDLPVQKEEKSYADNFRYQAPDEN
jgi:NADH dehydrogenase (ubiquinone) Fe-S protein 4